MALPLNYHWRSLLVRKFSAALTFLVVALVVLVLAVLLSFASGIRASLDASASSRNVIVLARGATAESTSILLPEEAARVQQAPGIVLGSDGTPLTSFEVCVQTSIPRLDGEGATANVGVRGVDESAFLVHSNVRMVEGRRFEAGQLEVVVGRAAQKRYANLSLGQELKLGRLGNRLFRVVGIFESGGGALESEIWGPRPIISDVFNRSQISSVVFPLQEAAELEKALEYVNGPAVGLDAKSEAQYYRELSSKTREIVVLATILISIMSVGAAFAVANTMYAAVDGRRREIALLRTIGFRRRSILVSFTLEALMVCVPACALGLAASLLLSGRRQDYLSDQTWTVLAFELRVTPQILLIGLGLSVVVGVGGALAPAIRAARTRIIEALRKA